LNSALNPFLHSLSYFDKVKTFFSLLLGRPNNVERRNIPSVSQNTNQKEIPVSLDVF